MSVGRDRRPRAERWRAPPAGLAAGLLVLVLAAPASAGDTQAALREGNRLFRDGRIEAAVAAYLEGYEPSAPHPTLLYNLGTALHHLDRLPEAVLWYRRAACAGDRSEAWRAADPRQRLDSDPWLQENLWLARRSLGSQSLPPGGSLGWLSRHTASLRAAALALAWVTLLAVVVRESVPAAVVTAAAVTAVTIYGAAAAVERWGPQPAVVLENCPTPAGELPAGTEVWVRPAADAWRVTDDPDLLCPEPAIGLVLPR